MATEAAVGCYSDKEHRLFLWTNETVENIWPDLEVLLLRDQRWSTHYTLEAFRELVRVPGVYTWTFHDGGGMVALLITQFQEWPAARVLDLRWMAAEPPHGLRAVQYGLEVVELWAKRMGAERIEVTGRPGWMRVLPDYEPHAVVLSRDLSGLTEH